MCLLTCLTSGIAAEGTKPLHGAIPGSTQQSTVYGRHDGAPLIQTERMPPVPQGGILSESSYSARSTGIRMTISLLVVLALIAAGVFLLKKITPYRGFMSGMKHPILVLSRIPLGRKRCICLVKIADQILVIGLTNTDMSLLSRINADDYYAAVSTDIHSRSGEYGNVGSPSESFTRKEILELSDPVARRKRSLHFGSLIAALQTKLGRHD